MSTDPRKAPSSAFVAVRDLTKRYGELTAVDDVSFAVGEGHTLALLGPSGCGKTTMLRCLAGLETPERGPHPDRRQGGVRQRGDQPDAGAAPARHRVPVLRGVAAHDGRRERRLSAEGAQRPQGRAARARRRRCWTSSAWAPGSNARRPSSPAASSSASRWRARWCTSRGWCCSTSRCRTSTRSCASRCAWS